MADSKTSKPPPLLQEVIRLPRPNDPEFVDLWQLWEMKRGARLLPSRSDFEPWEFKTLLADFFLIDVSPPPASYRFRLLGENVICFHGHNFAGKTFDECFEPSAAHLLTALFDVVVEGRTPVFRAGKAYWWTERKFNVYESCAFPLSADGLTTNMVFGAIRFPRTDQVTQRIG